MIKYTGVEHFFKETKCLGTKNFRDLKICVLSKQARGDSRDECLPERLRKETSSLIIPVIRCRKVNINYI